MREEEEKEERAVRRGGGGERGERAAQFSLALFKGQTDG